jgi:hypothetical protein
VLDWIDQGLGIQPHLVDLRGRDLADGADRSAWLTAISRRRFPFPPRGPIIVRKFASTVCVFNPPSGPPPLPVRPSLWVVPFLSLLCCTVSVYITLRLRRIEAAVNHFGSGQLGARAITESGDQSGVWRDRSIRWRIASSPGWRLIDGCARISRMNCDRR